MTVARYETLDTHSRSRPWRCSVAVPYSHKAHAPTIDRHITHADDKIARDRGVFFVGTLYSLQATSATALLGMLSATASMHSSLNTSDPSEAPQKFMSTLHLLQAATHLLCWHDVSNALNTSDSEYIRPPRGATGDLDAAPDLDLRREVAEKVMQLTEHNVTFLSTVDGPLDAGFPTQCDVSACLAMPRCAIRAPRGTCIETLRLGCCPQCVLVPRTRHRLGGVQDCHCFCQGS